MGALGVGFRPHLPPYGGIAPGAFGRPRRDPEFALRLQSLIDLLITVWCIFSKSAAGFLGKVEAIRLLRLQTPISSSGYFGRRSAFRQPSGLDIILIWQLSDAAITH
jgi:hypothetical protein